MRSIKKRRVEFYLENKDLIGKTALKNSLRQSNKEEFIILPLFKKR